MAYSLLDSVKILCRFTHSDLMSQKGLIRHTDKCLDEWDYFLSYEQALWAKFALQNKEGKHE